MTTTRLTLYSRSYCHLCEDLRLALSAFEGRFDFQLVLVDVDADPALVARYDELVPVLTGRFPGGSEQEICHYFLDPDALEAFFTGFASHSPAGMPV